MGGPRLAQLYLLEELEPFNHGSSAGEQHLQVILNHWRPVGEGGGESEGINDYNALHSYSYSQQPLLSTAT